MKYTKYSSQKRGNSAFYIILAICLAVIGIAAWFAFSKMADTKPDVKSDMPNNEYNSNNSSYNDNSDILEPTPQTPTPSTPTAEEPEDVPYEEPAPQKAYTMPVNGEISKDFSENILQYSATFGDMRIHNAIDIACKDGTLVSALTDGKVLSVEQTANLGSVITIDHGDGLIVKYAAIKDVKVKNGNTVQMGDTIGAVTTVPSECADQSHLHIEAYKDSSAISILTLFE